MCSNIIVSILLVCQKTLINLLFELFKIFLTDFSLAKWTNSLVFHPILDAFGVEVVASIARQRSHFVIHIELFQANDTVFLVLELVRVKLHLGQSLDNLVLHISAFSLIDSRTYKAWKTADHTRQEAAKKTATA